MSYNSVIFPRKLLKNFILLYKEQRCLWDRDSPNYRIKAMKHAALTKLTELVQEYDPTATRVHILRKIDSLRACVRREYKRIQLSRRTATSPEEIYAPSLWYFDLFSFMFRDVTTELKKEGGPSEQNTASEGDDDEVPDHDPQDTYDSEPYQEEYNISTNIVEVNERPSTSKRLQTPPDEDIFKHKRPKSSTEVTDEYDAIGVNVAAKLRYLPANMRILAEKLINDVLFQAQINGLNSSTTIVTTDPFKNEFNSASSLP